MADKFTIPETIYLQVYGDSNNELPYSEAGISWCADKINDNDEAYRRASTVDAESERLRADLARLREVARERPKIVCLCGSTRFKDAFETANYWETMAGKIVLSVGFYMHASGNRHGEHVGATPEQKIALDELHKRKIDLADEVFVLNVDGYIGDSTRSEVEYARAHNKPIRYLFPVAALNAKEGE